MGKQIQIGESTAKGLQLLREDRSTGKVVYSYTEVIDRLMQHANIEDLWRSQMSAIEFLVAGYMPHTIGAGGITIPTSETRAILDQLEKINLTFQLQLRKTPGGSK